jgi:TolB-like protein/class 3 adenylate cyclase/tetratricopeptide (TPR) repeat protein
MTQPNRQLAAILFTDIVGFTGMMQQDEVHAHEVVKRFMHVMQEAVSDHSGKILNDYGDGCLCSFTSATQAVLCAEAIQQQFRVEPSLPLRIGLHVGEIFFEENKALGDGVNVASRIQSLGQGNTILFSREVWDKIRHQPQFNTICLGMFEFKNVSEPMEVYALANDGLKIPKREEMSGKLKEQGKKSGRKKWLAISALIVLAALGIFMFKAMTGGRGFTGERTLAVLPFENAGTDNSEEYVSDGITVDIISKLSKISALQKVIGWISVKTYKKTKMSPKEIADNLGVVAILSGTIQKQGKKTHINAQLTEAGTGNVLWGNSFDYSGDDLLNVQSKVAEQIVTELKLKITPEERKGLTKQYTDNVEAYKYYLRGRSFWEKRTKEFYDSAERYYDKAIELDPEYALAWAGKADCYTYNQRGVPQRDAISLAEKYSRKALSYDSTLTEALTTLAFIRCIFYYEWKESAAHFKNIIDKNPNYALAHVYYSNVLLYMGNIEAGLDEKRRALSLDPLSTTINYTIARDYWIARKYDSAMILIQRSINLNPHYNSNYWVLGELYLQKKDYARAIEAFSQLPQEPYEQGADGRVMVSYAYAMSGNKTRANEILARVSDADRLKCPYAISLFYIAMGDFPAALSQLERAYEIRQIILIGIKTLPDLDPIRSEPRFKAILKKMNLE